MTPSGMAPLPPWQPADLPTLRAAYSDRTAALMAYLANVAYDKRIEGIRPVAMPAELAQLGFTQITTFHNGMIDGWAYIAESDLLIVLSFRGTQTKRNWDTNLHAWLVNPAKTNAKLLVHQGFYRAFELLSDGHQGIGDKVRQILSNPNDTRPIYITGHSLGGALAQIATAVLGNDRIAACYTFGSPRVGNKFFDLWVKPPSYRVMNYADIVPEVPVPIFYRHSGDARYIPDVVTGSPFRFQPNTLERSWQTLRGIIQFFRAGSILGIDDHRIEEYCRKLDRIAQARSQSR